MDVSSKDSDQLSIWRRAVALLAAAALGSATLALVTACEEEGPAERTGEAIDDAADDAGDAVEDAADDIEDAVDDAADGTN